MVQLIRQVSLVVLIGTRYLYAGVGMGFISLVSLASLLGVALGVAVLITVLSVMNGFNQEIEGRIFGMVPEITIQLPRQSLISTQQMAESLQPFIQDIQASAPYLEAQGLVRHRGHYRPVLLSGIVPEQEQSITQLHHKMIDGHLDSLNRRGFGLVMGLGLAQQLDVTVGDRVVVMLPEAGISPVGLLPRYKPCTVTGLFTKDGVGYEYHHVFMHADDLDLLTKRTLAHKIRLKLKYWSKAPQLATSIQEHLGFDYQVFDWTSRYSSHFRGLQMEKTMMFLTLSMLIAIAAFNLVSSQIMLVHEKRSDIAILRTMGASPGLILSVFIYQGLSIGCIGMSLGVLLGVLLAHHVDTVIGCIQWFTGLELFSEQVYFVDHLPSLLIWTDVQYIVMLTSMICLLVTTYPAWRAAKTNPVDVLKHDA